MGRGKGPKARIQEAILKKRHGLRIVPLDEPAKVDPRKTLAMRLMEQQHGISIEDLISEDVGSLATVAKILGIDESTVSKWRLRLGMRT